MICVIWSHAADDCSSHVTWTRMNWFKPESLKLALVIWPNVPMINMLILCCFSCMLCWESVYIFFLQTTVHLPRNNKNTWIICHVHYKGPMALINFKTSLVIFFFSCALTLYSYHFVDLKNVYFCWINVTPTLVIITVLSSCSYTNIRLIFVCNT